ncbi:MAG: YitT family protein [Bacteroidales bacterium]|nr:YitT family protein [Bacteroidales bacterium]
MGTAFNYGGSTGGTDIVALIITKFHNVSPGRVILYCDLCIISSSFIVFYYFLGKTPEESLRVVLYGFVVMTVTSYTIDLIVLGAQSSVQMLISSRKHEEIAEMISTEMHRGVTLLDAKGFYSKEQSNVLFAVVRKYEMQNVLRRIRDIDPDAFTSVTQATGVYGKGFQALK